MIIQRLSYGKPKTQKKKKKKILIVNLNSLLQASTRKVKIKPEIFMSFSVTLKAIELKH